MTEADQHEDFINRELVRMVCGDFLGKGIARHVYIFLPHREWVVKIESGSGSFQNVIEWETWQDVRDTKWAKWFAPCHFISPCGAVMLQTRTRPIGVKPRVIPNFMSDLQEVNFGRIGKQVVCHDYAFNLLVRRTLSAGRLVKPRRWYES